MNASIKRSVERIYLSGLATRASLRGCTSSEIEQLEATFGSQLPQFYRTFLALCGKGAGEFLIGTDWTFEKLPGLQLAAIALRRSCGIKEPLRSTTFVFAMHQGYQFLCFDCDRGDDPPIDLHVEGDPPHQVFEHFSHWLAKCVDDEVVAFNEMKN